MLTPYLKGTAKVTSSLYINSTAAPVCHICDDCQSAAVFNDGDWGSDKKLSDMPLHNQAVYDLQGRRLPDANHLCKGLYIIGNKKVVK